MFEHQTRRQFFSNVTRALVGVAGATAVGPIPSALAQNPRARAWELLNEASTAFSVGGKLAAIRPIEDLIAHLMAHFKQVSNDNSVKEIRTMFRHPDEFSVETCSDTAFVVLIVRDGLKVRNLPMVGTKGWRDFARNYATIVMQA